MTLTNDTFDRMIEILETYWGMNLHILQNIWGKNKFTLFVYKSNQFIA